MATSPGGWGAGTAFFEEFVFVGILFPDIPVRAEVLR